MGWPQRWAGSCRGFLSSSACPLGVGSWWQLEKNQVKEARWGEGRPGTRSHNKDRPCMEFVSPEICVSSFSMFFDSFPQLAVRYLLNLATALRRERQVWGLQALSLLPCLYMGAHTLCTHARAGTSSPRAHTNACARGHSSLPAHGRAPVAAGHRCLPAFEHPSCSVRAQTVPCQTRRACRRQICPCQARTAQETDLRACFVRLDPKPCVPVRCTVHGNDHRLAARVFIQARSRRCTD